MRKLTPDSEEDFFNQYSGIVYGVMKKLNIPRSNPDYEDFAQQGLIKLVEAYESFPWDTVLINSAASFPGYAYRKIQWHMLDLLRKQKKHKDQEYAWPEFLEETLSDTSFSMEKHLEEKTFLAEVLSLLDLKEQQYVLDVVKEQLSVTEIAKKRQVSRKTIYQWRKRIAQKLDLFLETKKER